METFLCGVTGGVSRRVSNYLPCKGHGRRHPDWDWYQTQGMDFPLLLLTLSVLLCPLHSSQDVPCSHDLVRLSLLTLQKLRVIFICNENALSSILFFNQSSPVADIVCTTTELYLCRKCLEDEEAPGRGWVLSDDWVLVQVTLWQLFLADVVTLGSVVVSHWVSRRFIWMLNPFNIWMLTVILDFRWIVSLSTCRDDLAVLTRAAQIRRE